MASVDTTLGPPAGVSLAGRSATRSRSPEVRVGEASARRSQLDEDGGVFGLVAGFGVLLVQVFVIVPGFLPGLLLLLPLVLPVIVLGLVVGLLAGVAHVIRRVVTAVAAALS